MKDMKGKISALVLVICIAVVLLPVVALAESTTNPVKVGGNTYATLLEAVNAAKEGDTIYLINDYTVTTAANTLYCLPKGATLDLQGNKLKFNNNNAYFAGENITIQNGSIEAVGTNKNYALYIGDANTKTSITVENVDSQGGINVNAGAVVALRNNKIACPAKYYAVYAADGTKVTIESGTYKGGTNNTTLYEGAADGILVYGGTFTFKKSNSTAINKFLASEDCVIIKTTSTSSITTYTVVHGTVQGAGEKYYTSIQSAVDAGETSVTLLKDRIEDFAIKTDFTLKLGSKNLTDKISVAEGVIEVDASGNTTKDVSVHIEGDAANASSIKLAEPHVDHCKFVGWCHGTNAQELAIKENGVWLAEINQSYHTHWEKSGYTHEDLHFNFETQYGVVPTAETVTFKVGDLPGSVIAVTQSNYFTVSYEPGKSDITITPKQGLNVGTYTDVIRVTVGDQSEHGVYVNLKVTKADSAVALTAQTSGLTVVFTASVTGSPDEGVVTFYCGGSELGSASVTQGVAIFAYDTAWGGLALGSNTVTASYGGSGNLNNAASSPITVTLTAKAVDEHSTETLNGAEVTGPAVEQANGTVSVMPRGRIGIGGKTYEVVNGAVTLNADGTITVPAGASVIVGGETITGSALITSIGVYFLPEDKPAAAPPQTGDNHQPLLCLALAAVSLAGMCVLQKKRA